jgi:hypothetical protein
MIGSLIGIILVLLVAGFCYWACQQLIALVPLGQPFATLINIVMMLIILMLVIWAIVEVLGIAGVHVATPFK